MKEIAEKWAFQFGLYMPTSIGGKTHISGMKKGEKRKRLRKGKKEITQAFMCTELQAFYLLPKN